MAEPGLKQKAAKGVVWTALQRYSTMFIQFVSGVILARLLTPYDYGCIGMLTIFMSISEAFIEGGFGSALIQKKRPTQEDYSTIFYWNLGVSLLMYLILFCAAPAIARFYKIPLLCNVLRVQGLVLLIYAFNIVQRNQLRKKLNFKVLSLVSVSTSLIALTITVVMAYRGFGVWALVTQNLLASAIPALVFWFYIRWRPLAVFSWKSFRELFSFGFYMFLTSVVDRFSKQLSGLVIGRVYNAATLGYYSKALGTERLASHSISQVVMSVSYPLYAEVQDRKKELMNIIRRMGMTIAYVTFPLMYLLMLLARPLFILLYSERWLESIPYFQVLCFAGFAACLQSVNFSTISAMGKSKVTFTWTLIKRSIGLCAMIGGLLIWGMKGLLGGVIVNTWFSYFVNIGLVSKHVGYKWSRQLLDLMPVAVAATVAAGISYGAGYLLNLPMYWDGALKLVIYLAVYAAWSLLLRPEAFRYSLTLVPERFRFWEKRNKEGVQ